MNQISAATLSNDTAATPHSLIVLIYSDGFDLTFTARRVWQMAEQANARVLFLGLAGICPQESALRRDLATLSALVANEKILAETEIISALDWVSAVKTKIHAGDLLLCVQGKSGGLTQISAEDILQRQDLPVYLLSDRSAHGASRASLTPQIVFWLGSLLILGGFFFLEVEVARAMQGAAQTLVISLLILLESGAIWAWNSFS